MLIRKFLEDMLFWMAWIIIPLVMEIIPAIGGFLILLKKRRSVKADAMPARYPEITLIIPVYNSAETLEACIKSVALSDYPEELIQIMLVDNGSKDESFAVFCRCQEEFPNLSMQWLHSQQGKSKAINLALFNSSGKYIIHIDSDGLLEQSALTNMVERFEANHNIHCMTGVIMTSPELIDKTEGFWLRLMRKCEFCEYGQAFLAGRNFESELDSIYTLSGAFSAFRRSAILKTQMYNPDTVGEDTHITFQIRKLMKKSVHLCENALFFVEPIESFDKLYTQRQRWQRGELEVSHVFLQEDIKKKGFLTNFMVRRLTFDHTFAFPRMIWYFGLLCLAMMNYPMKLIFGSVVIVYLLYVFSAFLYYLNIVSYLKKFSGLRKYYAKKLYIIPILPAYNFVCFWVRFAGIINSVRNPATWRTRSFSEERKAFSAVVKSDFKPVVKLAEAVRRFFNGGKPDEKA